MEIHNAETAAEFIAAWQGRPGAQGALTSAAEGQELRASIDRAYGATESAAMCMDLAAMLRAAAEPGANGAGV